MALIACPNCTLKVSDTRDVCVHCNQSISADSRAAGASRTSAAYGGGGGGGGGGQSCYSGTLGKQMPPNACVQSRFDGLWYQCSLGSWVDRWSDPDACNGVYPL